MLGFLAFRFSLSFFFRCRFWVRLLWLFRPMSFSFNVLGQPPLDFRVRSVGLSAVVVKEAGLCPLVVDEDPGSFTAFAGPP
jgi:hypothetical protein